MSIILEANGIDIAYPKVREILKDVSIQLQLGEVVAISGASGSGKTSLWKVLGLLMSPSAGSLISNGYDLLKCGRAMKRRFIRENVGYVFQESRIFLNWSAIDNVALAFMSKGYGKRESVNRAMELCEKMHIRREALSSETRDVSGGEKQRLAIARAIAKNPKILLCDEPTGSLDDSTGGGVIDLLCDISHIEDVAVLIVTHNPSVMKKSDILYKIENKTLVKV